MEDETEEPDYRTSPDPNGIIYVKDRQLYVSMIQSGAAVPRAYNNLVEAAIKNDICPPGLALAWTLKQNLWSALMLACSVPLLTDFWYLSLTAMCAVLWRGSKDTSLSVVYAYQGVSSEPICDWILRCGYADLHVVPNGTIDRWKEINEQQIRKSGEICWHYPDRKAYIAAAVFVVVTALKLALAAALVRKAWVHPTGLSLVLAVPYSIFVVVQFLTRLPSLLSN